MTALEAREGRAAATGNHEQPMSAGTELSGFHGDRPVVTALVLCDAVAVIPGSNKLVLIGLFDVVNAFSFPPQVNGAAVATLIGVNEPIDCRFEAIGYTQEKPLGSRQVIGTFHVEPPDNRFPVNAMVQGLIAFPVTEAGMAEVRLYGNGELLASRPIFVAQVKQVGGQGE